MHRIICLGLTIIMMAMGFIPAMAASDSIPQAGQRLSDLPLAAPENPHHRAYLGISSDRPFLPTEIAGRLLFIEIFNMYCPHCQKEAPAVNRLYESVEASPILREGVRLIGLGVGNSPFEVEHFRNHYRIDFPLFADEAFAVHQRLGEVRTPFFLIVALAGEDRGTILWTAAGSMGTVESVVGRLEELLQSRRTP